MSSKIRSNIDQILLAVGEHMNWHGNIAHVLVSERTKLNDFGLTADERKAVAARIGVPVKANDYLWDIVKRMGRG